MLCGRALIKMEKSIKRDYKDNKKQIKTKYKADKKKRKKEYRTNKKSARESYYEKKEAYCIENGLPIPKNPPKRCLLEEIGNSVTHGLGALFALVAVVLMLKNANDTRELFSAVVYSAGLFVAFFASSLYHAFSHGSAVKRLFRRFDYSSIYLLIGATFAPILISYIGGVKGMLFLVIQWLVIAVGISLIGVFGPGKLRFIHFPLYFLLGWSGLILMPELFSRDVGFFVYIIAGGIVYSLGIIPFAIKAKISHFIWHVFVLGGALLQWIGIYKYVF